MGRVDPLTKSGNESPPNKITTHLGRGCNPIHHEMMSFSRSDFIKKKTPSLFISGKTDTHIGKTLLVAKKAKPREQGK